MASEYGGVTDLSYNAKVPGMMVTCSIDKTVTLWDVQNNNSVQTDKATAAKFLPPRPCGSKDMCAGKLYAVGFYPSSPWLLATGGSGNQLSLWDLSSEEAIQTRFKSRVDGTKQVCGSGTTEPEASTAGAFQAMMSRKEESPAPQGAASASNGKESAQKKKKGKPKQKAHRKS